METSAEPVPPPNPHDELAELTRALAAHLGRAAEAGYERLPREARLPGIPVTSLAPAPAPSSVPHRPLAATPSPAPVPVPPPAKPSPPRPARAPEPAATLTPPAPPPPAVESPEARDQRARAAACANLTELRGLVAACQACDLARTRTQTVFSDGRAPARVMFVGEAPGQHEDERGVPFVGAAGQLLTDIIQKGMGLPRAEVHIANVLKCRPPDNREPAPEEKALCTPFLDRQIELVDPAILIALGLHAARHLLRSPLSMGRLRGKVHLLNGRKVVATYHPAFLLRNPAAKKDCWQDIQLAMREIGLEPPPSARRGVAP